MKKFCNKISNQQWRVSVPNINSSIFRKSPTSLSADEGQKRVSTGCYNLEAAQEEYDLKGTVSQQSVCISSSDSEDDFEDAASKQVEVDELYTEVETVKRVESKTLTECNNKYEYDVPKISFSFFENGNTAIRHLDDDGKPLPLGESKKHKSEVKIVLSPPPPPPHTSDDTADDMPVVIKSGSDPNISHSINDEEEDDGFYKVPKSINQNRLSKSLHDFNSEDVNLCLSPSDEDIEHISCSQVIVEQPEDSPSRDSVEMEYCKARSKLPAAFRRVSLLRSPRGKAVDKWTNFKTKFSKIMEEHSSHQRVGAFADKEKIVVNIEEMYKNSRDKCKRMLKSTGKMFKQKRDQENVDPNSDSSSRIVKNDAFFARVELKASDIEYVFDKDKEAKPSDGTVCGKESECVSSRLEATVVDEGKKDEFDLKAIKNGFRKSRVQLEGQNGFDDLRRYVKQGGDFCKELSTILQERADAETQYSKSLSKLSVKLSRACREGVGGLNEAWKVVAAELEARAEAHRQMGVILLEETARPLRTLTENQHRSRKHAESVVDKAARVLADWRAAEAKSKKHSHACARDNEKLQDAMLDSRLSRTTSLIQLPNIHKANSDKDSAKLEGKKRKAEDAVKKADIEYYSHCVRSERARLEWESAVLRGAATFQTLEEERLNNLKSILTCYLNHNTALTPKLDEATEKIRLPIEDGEPQKDLTTFISLRQSSQQTAEQLLPDFYCEHITLAMNRERRKQALVKLLQLIKQDIDRERKSKDGLENLSKAIKQTPTFGSEDSQQTVTEKLYHMKSMLTYLEGARYKVQSALAELDCRPRNGHPLASHITITRDKAGLQQSVLKVPQWLREQWIETEKPVIIEKREDAESDGDTNWIDRGMADGNSNQPDSDFDEFSSQGSSICEGICNTEETQVQPIARCKVLYTYTPNLPDELAIRPGDMVSVYRQQEDGWWLGECNGSVGIFPATYVETIST